MGEKVYLNAPGKFLPGAPVDKDEIENRLGLIGGKPSRLKRRILAQNGIKTRHYAIDKRGEPNFWNNARRDYQTLLLNLR